MTPQETFTPPDTPPAPASAWEAIKRLLASLLTSRKVVTAIVGLVVLTLARRGIVLEPDMVAEVVTIFAVLIGAQGLADTGKEKAKVEAQTPPLGLFGMGKKDAIRIGAGVAGQVLPGAAGRIAGGVADSILGGKAEPDAEVVAVLRNHEARLRKLEGKG